MGFNLDPLPSREDLLKEDFSDGLFEELIPEDVLLELDDPPWLLDEEDPVELEAPAPNIVFSSLESTH